MFHDEFLKKVQTSGAGWVDYMFSKQGFKVDGMAGLIGAGFFTE